MHDTTVPPPVAHDDGVDWGRDLLEEQRLAEEAEKEDADIATDAELAAAEASWEIYKTEKAAKAADTAGAEADAELAAAETAAAEKEAKSAAAADQVVYQFMDTRGTGRTNPPNYPYWTCPKCHKYSARGSKTCVPHHCQHVREPIDTDPSGSLGYVVTPP